MLFRRQRLVISAAAMRRLPAWRRHLLSGAVVATLCGGGAALGGAISSPHADVFASSAEITVTNLHGNDADTRRLAAAMQQRLLSPVALTLAISDLGLKPADVTGVEEQGRLGIFLDMVFGMQKADIPANAVEAALQTSVSIVSSSDDAIAVNARAATPEAAQSIVDYLARRVARDVGTDPSQPELRAVDDARKALDTAEAALTGFQMRLGNEAVSHMQALQQRAAEAQARRLALAERERDLSQAYGATSTMKAEDVLTKALPALPAFASLEPVRESYGAAQLALAEVNVDHGPKHPRTIAALGAVDAARAEAMPAMRRALEQVKTELKEVSAGLTAQIREISAIDEELKALGNAPSELAALERSLDTARRDYLAASEKAGPFATPRVSAAITRPALPGVAQHDTLSSLMMMAGGALVGLLAALFALSFRRSETQQPDEARALQDIITDEPASAVVPTMPDHPAAVATVFSPAEPDGPMPPADIDDMLAAEMEPDIFHDMAGAQAPSQIRREVAPMLASEPFASMDDDGPANDIPFDDRLRHVVMANRQRRSGEQAAGDGFRLPPLLAAALEGRAEHAQAETEEVRALRQELARLKARLNGFGADDIGHRRA